MSSSSLGGQFFAALSIVVFFAMVVGYTTLRNRHRQRLRDVQSLAVEQAVAPRLGGSFHRLDSEGLLRLPFMAFTQWGGKGRLLENVVTYTGPFGYAAHAFDYTFYEQALQWDGTVANVPFDQRTNTPLSYYAVGVLVGLPKVVPTVVVTSFPGRAPAPLTWTRGVLQPLAPIPPGATADQAFWLRFRTEGGPQTVSDLLTPAVKDGLLRGPPGVHVELLSGWLLCLAPGPMTGGPGGSEVVIAEWANWLAPQLPLDYLPVPPPPS